MPPDHEAPRGHSDGEAPPPDNGAGGGAPSTPPGDSPQGGEGGEPKRRERIGREPVQPPGGWLGVVLQVGVIEFVLALVLLAVGLWALAQDKYDVRLNLFLGGGFIGIWVLGGVVRWVANRLRGAR